MFLEVVPFEVEDMIRKVSSAPDFKDNIERIRYLNKYMAQFGFVPAGSGTNRTVFKHPDTKYMADGYDVVFKIALDSRGVKDNGLEHDIFFEAPSDIIEKGYLIEVFEKSDNDLILVSREADLVMTLNTYCTFMKKIHEMFSDMDEYYLLDDMDPANLAVMKYENPDGSIEDRVTIIDSANIVKKDKLHLFCTSNECVGMDNEETYLTYTRDMKQMFCPRCGAHYTFADIKGTEEMTEEDVYKAFAGRTNGVQRNSQENNLLGLIDAVIHSGDEDYVTANERNLNDYDDLISRTLNDETEYEARLRREEEYNRRKDSIVENNFYSDTTITPSQLETIIREDDYYNSYDEDEEDEVFDINNYNGIGYEY